MGKLENIFFTSATSILSGATSGILFYAGIKVWSFDASSLLGQSLDILKYTISPILSTCLFYGVYLMGKISYGGV